MRRVSLETFLPGTPPRGRGAFAVVHDKAPSDCAAWRKAVAQFFVYVFFDFRPDMLRATAMCSGVAYEYVCLSCVVLCDCVGVWVCGCERYTAPIHRKTPSEGARGAKHQPGGFRAGGSTCVRGFQPTGAEMRTRSTFRDS